MVRFVDKNGSISPSYGGDSNVLVQNYSYIINYRVKSGSKREKYLEEICKAYGLDVCCKLIDRVLEDSLNIIVERKRREKEIAVKEAAIAEEKRELYGG
jgi:hypothetical protein